MRRFTGQSTPPSTVRRVLTTALLAVVSFAASIVPVRAQTAMVVEYYHVDALGSLRAVTDQSQAVIERHDYAAFGEEIPPPGIVESKVRFTGKEHDAETGLDYFGARYYSNWTGRFTTVDPEVPFDASLRDPQLWNRYTYVRNNPLRYADPDGRCIWDLCVAEIAVAVGVTEAAVAVTEAAGASVVVWHYREGIANSIQGAGAALGKAVIWAKDALSRTQDADGSRFAVEPNGTVVDTNRTPAGRYRQPNGDLTDVLQKNDHGAGHSHTHEVDVNRNPEDPSKGSTRKSKRTHDVTDAEAQNIEDGTAKRLPAKQRQ